MIGPTLAPVNKVKEYSEIAVARLSLAASPIKVIKLGINIAMADTNKIDKQVMKKSCFEKSIKPKEQIIRNTHNRMIFKGECFFNHLPLKSERGVPIKPIQRL